VIFYTELHPCLRSLPNPCCQLTSTPLFGQRELGDLISQEDHVCIANSMEYGCPMLESMGAWLTA